MNLISKTVKYFKYLGKFIGPGFMIAVGYLDPGNWATDLEGGSSFGYRLLFIILLSNFIAIFLQNLTIRLGTVSGFDLAVCCRRYLPKYVSLFLYVLAESAIIATDLAEVIGSAIALNLLFPSLPLPAGVAITAVDVFIILLFYKEPTDLSHSYGGEDTVDKEQQQQQQRHQNDDTTQMVRYFEIFVMLLVLAVGVCFIIELAYSEINTTDLLKGYLPSKEIFTDRESLYVSIGIIGATVMPHNLFLHSYIIQARCHTWRYNRPLLLSNGDETNSENQGNNLISYSPLLPSILSRSIKKEKNNSKEKEKVEDEISEQYQPSWKDSNEKQLSNIVTMSNTNHIESIPSTSEIYSKNNNKSNSAIEKESSIHQQRGVDVQLLRQYLKKNLRINLHYGFMDLIIALLFAFFVNSSILIVASANFYYGHEHIVSDLFDAHALLGKYLGPPAAVVFALALLFSGQSSTLTATLAGQVVMSGFLGMTSKPWVRRIVTRSIAILPAMIAACIAGRSGLSQMLIASQVVLSIQLPFAVVPLVYFTSLHKVMGLDLIVNHDKFKLPSLPLWLYKISGIMDRAIDRWTLFIKRKWTIAHDALNSWRNHHQQQQRQGRSSSVSTSIDMELKKDTDIISILPEPIYYVNGKCVIIIAILISTLLIGLNGYLVVQSILGD
ncbi:natural resistance-associated macrophage protein-domain-containing protein [Cunninghamella echinulata]|nr:natural resistance-associated macrophage protein-domain-containing protein [Cunninghamella echinulata]